MFMIQKYKESIKPFPKSKICDPRQVGLTLCGKTRKEFQSVKQKITNVNELFW